MPKVSLLKHAAFCHDFPYAYAIMHASSLGIVSSLVLAFYAFINFHIIDYSIEVT